MHSLFLGFLKGIKKVSFAQNIYYSILHVAQGSFPVQTWIACLPFVLTSKFARAMHVSFEHEIQIHKSSYFNPHILLALLFLTRQVMLIGITCKQTIKLERRKWWPLPMLHVAAQNPKSIFLILNWNLASYFKLELGSHHWRSYVNWNLAIIAALRTLIKTGSDPIYIECD